jgi:2,4-dienoyl-CoA reductase-like NADH-dependent reductase (Old Yellow Enzyme family)
MGSMTARNMLVMSPMETMHGTPDGLPSARTRDNFAARTRGGDSTGLGLIRKATEDGARAACAI